jgi:hypothetical protein
MLMLLSICLLVLTAACASEFNALVAQRGAEASDQAVAAAFWTICNAAPVGAIKRRIQTPEEIAAYNVLCPDNALPSSVSTQ